jgi:hypothetical protein
LTATARAYWRHPTGLRTDYDGKAFDTAFSSGKIGSNTNSRTARAGRRVDHLESTDVDGRHAALVRHAAACGIFIPKIRGGGSDHVFRSG